MTWSGRKVTRARAYWRARIIAAGGVWPCWRCRRPVTADTFTVGHLIDRALGGSATDPANQAPECRACNFRAGGRLGAAVTNSRRPTTVARLDSERGRGIRGW